MAGWELGFAQGQRKAVEHLAAEILHSQACEMAGIAVATARGRHGAGWAAEIERQATQ